MYCRFCLKELKKESKFFMSILHMSVAALSNYVTGSGKTGHFTQ